MRCLRKKGLVKNCGSRFGRHKKLRSQVRHLVIVTNEIFSEAASYEGDTIRYQEYLGIINQNIGKMADEVVEVVYGIPIWHKGGKIIENAVE